MFIQTKKIPGLALQDFSITWNKIDDCFITNYIFEYEGKEIMLSEVGIGYDGVGAIPLEVQDSLYRFYMNSLKGIYTLKMTLEEITKASKLDALSGFRAVCNQQVYPECLEQISPYFSKNGLTNLFKQTFMALLPQLEKM